MRYAQRTLKLGALGTIPAGEPVPDTIWYQLRPRTQSVLTRQRRVVDKPVGFVTPGRTCLTCANPVSGRAKKCDACRKG